MQDALVRARARLRFERSPFILLIGLVRRALLLGAWSFISGVAIAGVSYVYDDSGRLIQAIQDDGSSTQYDYDAKGNITAIRRLSAATVAITAFMPSSGPVGTAVTLSGSGFSTTPSSNTVSFNGATATVTSATSNQITVLVPASATTGL